MNYDGSDFAETWAVGSIVQCIKPCLSADAWPAYIKLGQCVRFVGLDSDGDLEIHSNTRFRFRGDPPLDQRNRTKHLVFSRDRFAFTLVSPQPEFLSWPKGCTVQCATGMQTAEINPSTLLKGDKATFCGLDVDGDIVLRCFGMTKEKSCLWEDGSKLVL